jgi:hypothetical protein
MQRAAAPHPMRLGFAGEEVVIRRDDHRDKDDGVVEQMQLESREPELYDARRRGGPEQGAAREGLALEQCVLDVMPELDDERGEPPRPRSPHEARQQHPNAGQHDHGISVVQHLGVYEPRKHLAQDTPRVV